MTREEAKELLIHVLMTYEPRDQYGDLDDSEPYEEAMTMAIEALRNCSEKPNGSLISRQDIKYHTQLEARGNGQYEEVEVAYKNDIESLPSAVCDDCIWHICNYNKMINHTEDYAKGYNDAKREIALSGEYERCYKRGYEDASAEPKTGKWIYAKEQLEIVPMWECSCCRTRIPKKFNYCPNCGAKMNGGDTE